MVHICILHCFQSIFLSLLSLRQTAHMHIRYMHIRLMYKHTADSFFVYLQSKPDEFKPDKFKYWISSSIHHVPAKILFLFCLFVKKQQMSDKFKCRISSSVCFGPTGSPCWISSIFILFFFFLVKDD